MSKERRKYQRKPLIFFGRAFERQTGQFLGTVADITVIGLMVISDRELEIDKTFQLRVELRQSIFETDSLELEARSIWCRPDIDPAYFNTGFVLLNVSPETEEMITRIIQEYKIRD